MAEEIVDSSAACWANCWVEERPGYRAVKIGRCRWRVERSGENGLPSVCLRVTCWNIFFVEPGPGRPRRYCSDECRRRADTDRKRCLARIEQLRDQLRREEHLLAAMTEPTNPRGQTEPQG